MTTRLQESVTAGSTQQSGVPTRPAPTALQEGLAVVREEVEQELGTLLEIGLDTALTDEGRGQLQHQADVRMHLMLEEAIETLPAPVRTHAARHLPQIEQECRRVVWTALEALWAGSLRAELEKQLEGVARALLQGDVTRAEEQVGQTLRRLCTEILTILLDHWSQVERALMPVLAEAVRATIGTAVQEGLQSAARVPAGQVDKAVIPDRRQIARRGDQVQAWLAVAKEELEEHLQQGLEKAVREGMGQHRALGHAPLHPPPAGAPRRLPPGAESS